MATGSTGSASGTTSATPLFNISGITSGLDTNTIVSELVSIARAPETLIQRQEQVTQARSSALTAIQTQLQTLQSSAATLSDPATWGNSQTVTSSNPSTVGATWTSGAAAGGYDVNVSQLAGAAQLTQGSSLTAASADDTLTIQMGSTGGVQVAVSAGDSLQTIADKINGTANVQVYATVLNNQLVLSGTQTGAANTISVTSTGSLATDLGFTQSIAPRDARFTVNGTAYDRATNIVSDVIAGVTMTLNSTTGSGPDTSLVVSTPAPSTTSITNAIQSFVSTYNATVNMIEGYVNQAKVANPQTQADMNAGMLEGDPTLLGILSNLRNTFDAVQSGLPSGMNNLAEAGLSTGAAVGSGTISQASLNGDMTLDTTALTSALSSNFGAVKSLFTNLEQNGDPTTEGLAQRMNDIITPISGPNGVLAGDIASQQTMITDDQDQIAEIEQRVTAYEAQLRTEFTNMEVALAQLQQQGSALGTGSMLAAQSSSGSSSSSSSSSG